MATRPRKTKSTEIAKNNIEVKTIEPLTDNQARALEFTNHQFLYGTAGTGKTFLAFYNALTEVSQGHAESIKIIRSATPSKDLGFLPGSLEEKLAQYEQPYQKICSELTGRGDSYDMLKTKGVISFESTSYLRGCTFDKCVVILDEVQNCGWNELNVVLTRLGKESKLIICGDLRQSDLEKMSHTQGIKKGIDILRGMRSIQFIEFTPKDIVRSDFVRDWIIACNDYEDRNRQ
jgi:phosphate starvation-inducible PhoH-like protein